MKHITVLTYRFEGSNELETKTILGKIDYAVFTKEVTS